MKFYLLFSISLLLVLSSAKGQDCDRQTALAIKYIEGDVLKGIPQDFIKARELLEPCIGSDKGRAMDLLGLIYSKGLGVEVDLIKAFELYKQGAEMGSEIAQFNLGTAYRLGAGTTQDYTEAVKWLKKSASQRNPHALYMVGAMYFKGLGVPQSYEEAISYFKRSETPMSRHFLARCYYYGFGVEQNTQKALEILRRNIRKKSGRRLGNSEKLMQYILAQKKQEREARNNQQLSFDNKDQGSIQKKAYTDTDAAGKRSVTRVGLDSTVLTSGKTWHGKLILYDWSEESIQHVWPISLSIIDGMAQWTFDGQTQRVSYTMDNHVLSFDKLNFSYQMDYFEFAQDSVMEEQILSASFHMKTIDSDQYLVGSVKSYYDRWKEPGPPTKIILKSPQEASNYSDETILTDGEIQDLTEPSDHFITLFPNPLISETLNIAYELADESRVQVEIMDLFQKVHYNILPATVQPAGEHYHEFNVPLPQGVYIVRVLVDKQVYTRKIIKQ